MDLQLYIRLAPYPRRLALTPQLQLQTLGTELFLVKSLDHRSRFPLSILDADTGRHEGEPESAEAAAVPEAEAERAGVVGVQCVIHLRHHAPEILLCDSIL